MSRDRIALHIALAGALTVAGALAIGGVDAAIGAFAGAAVAWVNWRALRWLTLRILAEGSNKKRASAAILLAAKLGALAAVCWVLLAVVGVHSIGFALGLGALVLGVATGSARELADQADQAAGEES